MSKNDSKKKSGKKSDKKGKAKEQEVVETKKKGKGKKSDRFPEAAASGADEAASLVDVVRAQTTVTSDGVVTGTSPALLTDSLSKKERKAVEVLPLGTEHHLAGAEHLYRIKILQESILDETTSKKNWKLAEAEVEMYRKRGEAAMFANVKAEKVTKAEGKAKKFTEPAPVKVISPEVDEEVAKIKERVQAKQKARYDAMIAEGATEEVARQMSRYQALREEDPKGETLGDVGQRIMAADVDPRISERSRARELEEAAASEPEVTPAEVVEQAEAAIEQIEHEVTEVETGAGREFVVGAASTDAEVDLDPTPTIRRTKDGKPYIFNPEAGKEVIYRRVTTWIDVLDHKGALDDWKDRVLLIGAARAEANLDPDTDRVEVIGQVNDIQHTYEAAVKHLDKSLRKGKVSNAEHAEGVTAAEKTYKGELRALAEVLRERGDAHVAAQKGTDLHAVFEDYDNAVLRSEPSVSIDEWLNFWDGDHPIAFDGVSNADQLSPSDIADLRAYRAAMDAAGIEVVSSETSLVIDRDKVMGTADRILRYKPLNGARKITVIGDVKTGRVDYGAGKFSTQIRTYAEGEVYDPAEPEKRVKTGASKRVGILIHSPAGQGVTTIYEVDLSVADVGIKAIRAVHEWRSRTTEAQAFRRDPFYFEVAVADAEGRPVA